jgi:hypothetical protein
MVILATIYSRFFSFRLQSENVSIKIYKNVILPVILYWCETLSLTLME